MTAPHDPGPARQWFTAADLAILTLPDLPRTDRGVQQWLDRRYPTLDPRHEGELWRRRQGRGGGVEYRYRLLPPAAVIKLSIDFPPASAPPPPAEDTARTDGKATLAREERWAWFERAGAPKRQAALTRLRALDLVEALVRSGVGRVVAMQRVAVEHQVTLSTLYNWARLVEAVPRADWLPFLAPGHAGRAATADCAPEAWEALATDWLRPEKPAFEDCYRRLTVLAAAKGWTIPSARTLRRRLEALPAGVRAIAREGEDAAKRLFPAQQRDRGVFHALEAVNTDGHQFDVFVRWPDGHVGRPVMLAFQDLYSGKILAWRVDRSENADAFRLAFGDLVEQWGIPDHVYLDNTRAAANKWMTGGVGTRFRFKVKAEDPAGIFPLLGVEVHWTLPYSGQSKPIERAFRDLASGLAKHPAFAGAYTGNSPAAKPQNYGSKAVPLDDFLAIVSQGLLEHNARPGRTAAVCAGRSFDATFAASHAQHGTLIRRATAAQRRLWLLAAENVSVRTDGTVHLLGNRYWAEILLGCIGQKVTLRFDPEDLHQPLHVYRLDGAYVGEAACQEAIGFADTDAARAHGRARKLWLRAQREMAAAEAKLSVSDLAAMLRDATPEAPAAPRPADKVVRPAFGAGAPRTHGANALKPDRDAATDDAAEREALMLRALRQTLGAPRLVPIEEDDSGA